MKIKAAVLVALVSGGVVAVLALTQQEGGIVDDACPSGTRYGIAITVAGDPKHNDGLFSADIAVVNSEGQVTKLTQDGNSFDPSFSPDGSSVAFTVGSEYDDTGGFMSQRIASSNVDGTDVRDLTDGEHLDLEPAWSPDGDVIVFTRADLDPNDRDYAGGLMTVPVGGGEPKLLFAKDGFEPRSAEWSPDGQQIAFVADESIYVIEKDGSELRPVASDLGLGAFTWSPDGQTFAFTTDGIYTLTLEEPNPRQWASGSEFGTVEYSPDGSHFLYIVQATGRLRGDFEGTRLMIAPVDGGEPQIFLDENEKASGSSGGIGGYGGQDWLRCQ